jgi:hypothetical protein
VWRGAGTRGAGEGWADWVCVLLGPLETRAPAPRALPPRTPLPPSRGRTWSVVTLPLSCGLKLVMVVPRDAPGVPSGTASGIASDPATATAPLMVVEIEAVPKAEMGSSVTPPDCTMPSGPRVATRLMAPG